jgi:hypothetical protein
MPPEECLARCPWVVLVSYFLSFKSVCLPACASCSCLPCARLSVGQSVFLSAFLYVHMSIPGLRSVYLSVASLYFHMSLPGLRPQGTAATIALLKAIASERASAAARVELTAAGSSDGGGATASPGQGVKQELPDGLQVELPLGATAGGGSGLQRLREAARKLASGQPISAGGRDCRRPLRRYLKP